MLFFKSRGNAEVGNLKTDTNQAIKKKKTSSQVFHLCVILEGRRHTPLATATVGTVLCLGWSVEAFVITYKARIFLNMGKRNNSLKSAT